MATRLVQNCAIQYGPTGRIYATAELPQLLEDLKAAGDDGKAAKKALLAKGALAYVEPEGVAIEDDGEETEWTLKMGPEDYLSRYPDGDHAELAKKVLAASE